jgi:Tfp pilus assembly protein PilF
VASGAEAVFRQGAAALEANDFASAERLFRSIVDADPRAHPAWNALSVVAVRAGMPDVAAAHAERALQLDRRNPVYLNNLGVALGELGRFDESEQALRRALKARPAYAEGQFNLGKVLHKLGRLDESLRAFERAYAMDANFPGLRASLCQMYRKHARPERAMAVLREAPGGLEHDDEFTPVVAETLAELEGAAAAVAWMREVIARRPAWHAARFTLAQMLLSLGEWREGWREYQWRPNVLQERGAGLPAALPADLAGGRIRVRGEQGLGDTLFFLRFAAELRSRGAAVELALPRKLAAVLGGASGCEIVPEDAAAPSAARQVNGGDLPALLETDAVAGAFPLARDDAAAARWRRRLAELGPAPYLALTWRAGTDVLRQQEFGRHRGFLSKDVPPAALGAALRGWRGTLVSVQRAPAPGETEALGAAAGAAVHDLSAANEELPEVLALLSVVEEYACVSNTNVHLLAGIGRAARVLVPYPAEWRWMREGASPWFPGVAVYREPQSRGWEAPLAKLRGDLLG